MLEHASWLHKQLGNYRLSRLLGEGGFAEVYLGEHIHLGTQAAVKVLHTRLMQDDIAAFRSEARTIARLIHPHIVRVLDFGLEGRIPYLVMDYAPNGTLRQLHARGSIVPTPRIVSYVRQIASALQYAHDEKLIHRDVKPENMLVDGKHEVLLSDFGIALVAQSSRLQSTQEVVGTVTYMAPEQIQGKPRPASDQYALAIVVYEWLCGTRPFHGSFTEVCTQHMFAPPPPLHEQLPTIAPELEQVVMTALAKDPKERFASVQAFAIALEQAYQHSQAATIKPTPSMHVSPPTTPVSPSETFSPLLPPTSTLLEQTDASETPSLSKHPALAQSEHTSTVPATSGTFSAKRLSSPRTETPTPVSAPQRRLSRRAVIAGLAGGTAIAGGATWFFQAHQATSSHSAHSPQSNSTPPPRNPGINSSGTMSGYDLQHTHFHPDEKLLSPESASHLTPYWNATVGSLITSSPVVANSIVYISADQLYAFDLSGKLLWHTTMASPRTNATPAIANGVAYLGFGDGNLYAFDATYGGLLWSATIGSPVFSATVAYGNVYVGAEKMPLAAYKASDGTKVWSAKAETSGSEPAIVNGVIYISSPMLTAFDADSGAVLWSTRDRSGPWVGVGNPTVVDGTIYVSNFDDSQLNALNATTGKLLWSASVEVPTDPAIANGTVYVGSNNGKLYAFDAKNGKQRWSVDAGGSIYAAPCLANGLVYVSPIDSHLHIFRANNGKELWNGFTGNTLYGGTGGPYSSPTVSNGTVYIGSSNSKLYAFHLP